MRGAASGALSSRLIVAVPGIIAAVAVVAIGRVVFAIAMAVVAALALSELYSLTAAQRPLRWAGDLGTLLTIALAWAMHDGEHGLLLGLAASVGFTAVAALIVPRRDDITARIAATLFGVAYIGVPFAVLVLLRQLPHGAAAVVNVLVGVWVFDSASYFGGRMYGRRPVAPVISPRKTLEGALIGLVAGTLAVWIAGLYEPWIGGWESLALGLAICAAAFLGDLFESMIKRDVGAKDSGRLLLAHGGVLDRFDALLFGALAGYFVTVALAY